MGGGAPEPERASKFLGASVRLEQGDRLVDGLHCLGGLATNVGQQSEAEQHPTAEPRVAIGKASEALLEPTQALVERARRTPELVEGGGQLEQLVPKIRGRRERKSAAEVVTVVLAHHACVGRRICLACGVGVAKQPEEVVELPRVRPGVRLFVGERRREGADRREHCEPRLSVAAETGRHEACVEQFLEGGRHVDFRLGRRLEPVERGAAGVDGEGVEDRARVVVEQVVAPRDRRAERTLALGNVDRRARQERDALTEPACRSLGAEHSHSRGCELHGQREALERAADSGHVRRVRVGQLERVDRFARPIEVQPDRGDRSELADVRDSEPGRGEWLHAVLVLDDEA